MIRLKNSEYWRGRGVLLEAAQHKKDLQYLNALDREYRRAMTEMEQTLSVWYRRFMENNEISLSEAKRRLTAKEMSELRWTLDEYIRYGRENAVDQRWAKQLENASARFHITRLEAVRLQLQQSVEKLYGHQLDGLDKLLRDRYISDYYHNAFEIQKGLNMGWHIAAIPEKQLDQALSKPWSTDDRTFSDRIWDGKAKLNNIVQTELTQNIIQGRSPDASIQAIAERMEVSRKQAGRLVMTESSHLSAVAQGDCFRALDVERFEVVGTLDGDTCSTCGSMDGKVFKMSDYASGVTANPFHPWCRCCTAPYFDDNAGERIARDPETGETYFVDSDTKFEDWKSRFVDVGKELTESGTSDTINSDGFNLLGRTLRAAEASIKGLNYEVGVIVNKNGKVIHVEHGEESSVSSSSRWVKGNTFTHNHPSGACALSLSDIRTMINMEGYEVRAVTVDGRFVSLKKGAGTINKGIVDAMKLAGLDGQKLYSTVNEICQTKYGNHGYSMKELTVEVEKFVNGWMHKNAKAYGYIFTEGFI